MPGLKPYPPLELAGRDVYIRESCYICHSQMIRALASEGRASAMILSSLPIVMFLVIQVITPEFYASVWHEDLTKICLAAAGGWMLMGNLIMFRMVNFRI